jgi:hypothetical protein
MELRSSKIMYSGECHYNTSSDAATDRGQTTPRPPLRQWLYSSAMAIGPDVANSVEGRREKIRAGQEALASSEEVAAMAMAEAMVMVVAEVAAMAVAEVAFMAVTGAAAMAMAVGEMATHYE